MLRKDELMVEFEVGYLEFALFVCIALQIRLQIVYSVKKTPRGLSRYAKPIYPWPWIVKKINYNHVGCVLYSLW